jgi:hypothetical protein
MPTKHRLLLTCRHAMAAAPPSSHAMERPQWLPPSITLPPLQSAVIVSLLHSSNGSIEDAIYRHRPTYPGHLRPPPDPIKACPHFDGAPHTFMPALSSLGAKVPPPVHHLLAAIQAPVSGPPIVPRRPLRVATIVASQRGPKWPLGRAPVSHC